MTLRIWVSKICNCSKAGVHTDPEQHGGQRLGVVDHGVACALGVVDDGEGPHDARHLEDVQPLPATQDKAAHAGQPWARHVRIDSQGLEGSVVHWQPVA